MEGSFGAVAGGIDAGEGFVLSEKGIGAEGGGEFGFQAIGALNVPGGEHDLAEQSFFDGSVRTELEGVGGFKGFVICVVLRREEDGLLSVEPKFCGVGG